MTRSDFYVLPTPDPDARLRFACQLIEKVQALGHRVYVRTESESAARALDERLWDFREEAFVPHALVAANEDAPVQIGYGDSLPEHRDVYLNLALQVPEPALAFNRTLEVVIQEDTVLEATRANYRCYQQRGFEIHMNDMRAKR
ncbi:DNA polymerase III subunit chi [Motiliproteus sp. SC1-56]|uniref:DNA polymerase III subunit chi n=1 Tax=Motiliproteus sp. SC1-56 TaxID=2799565 RepID=UPI001A909A90|nr:DNA polymerase III subunit chi [Motiliproteus sp. SC1-56]